MIVHIEQPKGINVYECNNFGVEKSNINTYNVIIVKDKNNLIEFKIKVPFEVHYFTNNGKLLGCYYEN